MEIMGIEFLNGIFHRDAEKTRRDELWWARNGTYYCNINFKKNGLTQKKKIDKKSDGERTDI